MLPSIATPEFETTIPSSGQKIKFRPFLVKEEKILYFALESGEQNEMISAIKKIFENCILSEFNFDKLSYFDFEYIFLMLRAKSVGESIELSLTHNVENCGHVNSLAINIEDIKMQTNENHNDKFMLNDDIGIKMKYPTIDTMGMIQDQSSNSFDLVRNSIDFVYDNENVYDEFSDEEADAFLESLSKTQFEKITQFFETMPKLRHEVKYKCGKCNKEETVLLEGLQSFFT